MKTPRTLAFYLPQFHPTAENDEWWGPGFTEWTNVASAKRLFRSQEPISIPGELGFYDLRLRETRQQQAELAEIYGIDAFCYWHYWFSGKTVLDEVVLRMLSDPMPHSFALGWANQSWTGIWHGAPHRILVEQQYPGRDDLRRHVEHLKPFLTHPRYFRVGDRALLYVYDPLDIPDPVHYLRMLREEAIDQGIGELYLVGEIKSALSAPPAEWGLDAVASVRLPPTPQGKWFRRQLVAAKNFRHGMRYGLRGPTRWPIEKAHPPEWVDALRLENVHPIVVPNWDNTPRSGRRGRVLTGATPEAFAKHVAMASQAVAHKPAETQLLFIKSWNEWAEGNHMEPDWRHQRAWLEAVKSALGR